MADFIKFIDNNLLKEFFINIQKSSNKTWKEIILETKISRSSLDYYKAGHAIPELVFFQLLEYLPNLERQRFIEKVKNINSREWLSRGGKKAYVINLDKFEEGRLRGLKSLRKLGKKCEIFDFPEFNLSKEICEFIGAFIGDGFFNCYNNKLYQIEFSGDSRKDLDYYNKIIIPLIKKEIPELNPCISFPKDKNAMKVRFFSKKLFCFLKQEFGFKPGVKTYTVTIPSRILTAGEGYINRTIRGIFDTDGCVFFDKRKSYKKPYPRISLQTVSEPLFYQLKNYLSKDFSLNAGKLKNRDIYYIEVYGFGSLAKWMSKIGFSNKRHLQKIATVA